MLGTPGSGSGSIPAAVSRPPSPPHIPASPKVLLPPPGRDTGTPKCGSGHGEGRGWARAQGAPGPALLTGLGSVVPRPRVPGPGGLAGDGPARGRDTPCPQPGGPRSSQEHTGGHTGPHVDTPQARLAPICHRIMDFYGSGGRKSRAWSCLGMLHRCTHPIPLSSPNSGGSPIPG